VASAGSYGGCHRQVRIPTGRLAGLDHSPGQVVEASERVAVLAPQLAGHLGAGLVHPGQHSTASLGGLDGTVASCIDQSRRAQPVKVTTHLAGVAVAVDRGNPQPQ
jgi:hypothetical protein